MSRGRLNANRIAWAKERRKFYATYVPSLLAGLPALLTGSGVICLGIVVWWTPEERFVDRYADAAKQATERRDFETALLCDERLIHLTASKPKYRYEQALALEALGRKDRAAAIFAEIAPPDHKGYGPAHLRLAHELLKRENRSPQAEFTAELHLHNALIDDPDSAEANSMLGELYAATGRPRQAESHLLKAVGERPEALLVLARLAHARHDEKTALDRAHTAYQVFQNRAETRSDDAQARLNWATAAVYQNDHADAVAILERGVRLSGDPKYQSALATVYAGWARSKQDAKDDLGARLALLERGLNHDAANLSLLDQLLNILRENADGAERARAALRKVLATGNATAGAHFVLGIDAMVHGRADEARLHWDEANRLAPETPAVANNLAWMLAYARTPDLARALELANRAVELKPREPRFRDTRGRILFKMKRWAEALPDLELVLRARQDATDLHQLLAEAYDHLGSTEMAAEHRRLGGRGALR